jgi:hypothetical protein
MNRWYDRQVLECGSPLPLWRSWAIESARGLAQSKTLTRHWGRFMAPMHVRSWRSKLPMNQPTPVPSEKGRMAGRAQGCSPPGRGQAWVQGFKARNLVRGNLTPSLSPSDGERIRLGTDWSGRNHYIWGAGVEDVEFATVTV